METKTRHTRSLLKEPAHPMIELSFEFAQLKNLYRQGWLKRGIPKLRCESVADHSFSVALLGYVIAEEHRRDLDSNRIMKMGLFHEIGEIYAGDITPSDGINLEDKSAREYAAVQKVIPSPSFQKYLQVWKEFEDQKTPEARFVGQIDRLEMALQANLYERIGFTGLDEFFPYVQERISSPELKAIFDDLIRTRSL